VRNRTRDPQPHAPSNTLPNDIANSQPDKVSDARSDARSNTPSNAGTGPMQSLNERM